MAEIHKLKKNNKTILPVTTTEAVVDPGSNKTLNDVLKSFEAKEQKNKVNGYPGLDDNGKILKSQLPDNFQPASEKGRANGYPALDANGLIPDAQISNTVERVGNKNKANGYAGLDADGLLDNRQVRKAFGYVNPTSSGRILVNHDPLLNFGTNGFAIELIFTPKSRDRTQYLVQKTQANVSRWGCRLSSGYLSWHLVDNNRDLSFNAYIQHELNKTHHAIFTINGDNAEIYLNGELISSKSGFSDLSFDNDSLLMIGGAGSEFFYGDIALVRLYKRGFSQSDVDYYYNEGRPDLSRLTRFDRINKTTSGCVVELRPENATAARWIDNQNELDGVTNGDQVINYGNCTPEPYVAQFKKYIGLKKNGYGSGYCVFNFRTNKSGYARIRGGLFINRTTFSELGTSTFLPKGVLTTVAIKLIDNKAEVEIDNLVQIHQAGEGHTSNSPLPEIEVHEIANDTALQQSERNEVYGLVTSLPRDITSFKTACALETSLSGNYRDLPKSLESLVLNKCPNIYGDIKDLPKKLKFLYLLNIPTHITGDLADLPKELSRIGIGGYSSKIGGDVGTLKGKVAILDLTIQGNYTYNGGIVVDSNLEVIRVRPIVGVFTSEMVDNLLIDLSAQAKTAVGTKLIDLAGNCGPRTSKSDAAVESLQIIGFNVLTN